MFENLGDKLKNARINKNLSREQVSKLTGVSVSTIGLYESGVRRPSLTVLIKLSANYKVSIDYLLDMDTHSNDTLPLDGLTPKQIKALKLICECFRSQNGF